MRISLRLALIALTYAALAAAGVFHPTWACAYLLWIVAILSLVVAAVLLCFGRGPIQAKALGYLLLSCIVLMLIRYFPAVSPSRQALYEAGLATSQGMTGFSPWLSLMQLRDARFHNNAKVAGQIAKFETMIADASRAVAADAISVQLAGFAGTLVAGVTYRLAVESRSGR